MASKLENLSALFSNVKMRTVIIMTVIILLVVMLIGFLSFRRSNVNQQSAAQLTKASHLQSVPGLNPTTPQYAQVQQQVNEQNYQSAQQGGGTAIPTVIHAGSLQGNVNPAEFGTGMEEGAEGANLAGKAAGANAEEENEANAAEGSKKVSMTEAQLKALQDQQKAQLDAMQKKLDTLSSQQMQQELQQTQQSMQREAQQLMAAWTSNTSTPTQQYVKGTYKEPTVNNQSKLDQEGNASNKGNNRGTNANGSTAAPVIKAGSIFFGVLETAVNSDEPGPIMVKIVTGPYKGARLVGSIQNAQQIPGTNGPDKLILNFTVMSIPAEPESVSVSAVAIDPDTARTALASEVNYHYLQRYGTLFGSAFLEGWGQAIAQGGSTTTTNLFGTTTTNYGDLSGIDQVFAGLGQVGQSWGQQMGEVFRRKPTVEINSGISLGILFLSDVTLSNVVPPAGSETPLTTMPTLSNLPAAANAITNTGAYPTNTMTNPATNVPVSNFVGQQPAAVNNVMSTGTGNTLLPVPIP